MTVRRVRLQPDPVVAAGEGRHAVADPECTEWSNFVARSTFRLTVTDSNGKSAAIQADASAAAGFDPLVLKNVMLGASLAIRSITLFWTSLSSS